VHHTRPPPPLSPQALQRQQGRTYFDSGEYSLAKLGRGPPGQSAVNSPHEIAARPKAHLHPLPATSRRTSGLSSAHGIMSEACDAASPLSALPQQLAAGAV
jgi:hypothetical protein